MFWEHAPERPPKIPFSSHPFYHASHNRYCCSLFNVDLGSYSIAGTKDATMFSNIGKSDKTKSLVESVGVAQTAGRIDKTSAASGTEGISAVSIRTRDASNIPGLRSSSGARRHTTVLPSSVPIQSIGPNISFSKIVVKMNYPLNLR